MDSYKLRAGINLALLFLFAAWCLAEYVSPYKGWWIQRTFFTPTFNFDVMVDVTYDGKPYRIERTIECYRRLTSSAFGSGRTYGYFPDYGTFGTEASTGEAIIVATPAVCDSDSRRWIKGVKATNHNWHVDVPENHIPLLMVADSLDNPQQVIIYASKEAYKSPHARLQYVGMLIVPAKGMGRWFSDGRDAFSKFSNPKYENLDIEKQQWWSVSYAALDRKVWERDEKITRAVNDKKEITLIDLDFHHPDGFDPDFRIPFQGYGLMDGTDLRGVKRNGKRYPQSDGYYLYKKLMPFVSNDASFLEASYELRGMDILYKIDKDKFIDNQKSFDADLKIGEQIIDVHLEAKILYGRTEAGKENFKFFGYESPLIYEPKEDALYQMVFIGFETHNFNAQK